MIPGEIITAADAAKLDANVGLQTAAVEVSNIGDRPIQVGSHFHFFETNEALIFDRAASRGFRLNIPAGTAVRFEAGDKKIVELVALAGAREVWGLNAKINGPLEAKSKKSKAAAPTASRAKQKPAKAKKSVVKPKAKKRR
jgi:urease subunit beta